MFNNPLFQNPLPNPIGGNFMASDMYGSPLQNNAPMPGIGNGSGLGFRPPNMPNTRPLTQSPYQQQFDNVPNPFINGAGMPGWVNPDQSLNNDPYGAVYGNSNNPGVFDVFNPNNGNGFINLGESVTTYQNPYGNPYTNGGRNTFGGNASRNGFQGQQAMAPAPIQLNNPIVPPKQPPQPMPMQNPNGFLGSPGLQNQNPNDMRAKLLMMLMTNPGQFNNNPAIF